MLQKRIKENGPGGGLQRGNIELTVRDDEQGPFDAGGGGGGGVPKMPGWEEARDGRRVME